MKAYSIKHILFILLAGLNLVAFAQKTDSLFHINGNILLGEIKKLEYGQLTFKMEGMGTILVDYEKINTLKSDKFFEFTTTHSRIIYGFIDSSGIDGVININSGYDSSNLHLYQIVNIYPIKQTFFLRTSGKISLGFNYTKASNIGRVNVDWDLKYRQKGSVFSLTASTIQTYSNLDSLASSSKYDYTASLEKKIKGIWSWDVNLTASQNTELGLDLRVKGGFGLVGDIVHTNKQRFFFVTGVAPNIEVANDTTDNTANVEAQISGSYELFKFSRPEIHIKTRIDIYPSLNQAKRYRLDYNLDLNVEVFYNFFIGAKFYYNFDSKPASANAANDDYGITTSLGYSFH